MDVSEPRASRARPYRACPPAKAHGGAASVQRQDARVPQGGVSSLPLMSNQVDLVGEFHWCPWLFSCCESYGPLPKVAENKAAVRQRAALPPCIPNKLDFIAWDNALKCIRTINGPAIGIRSVWINHVGKYPMDVPELAVSYKANRLL